MRGVERVRGCREREGCEKGGGVEREKATTWQKEEGKGHRNNAPNDAVVAS